DEIHERDRFSDFMLAIIRDALPFCPHVRLILMSATMDSERFSQYFGGCPVIQVPGFTYPVKTFYLEDVLSFLHSMEDNHLNPADVSGNEENVELDEECMSSLDEYLNLALSYDEFDPLLELISSQPVEKIYNYQHPLTGVSPLMVFAGKGRVDDVCMLLSFGADCSFEAKDGSTALDWAERENQVEVSNILKKHMHKNAFKSADEQELLDKYLASVDPELIDSVLIERLLRKICADSVEGAILVFLPGWDDINRIREKLLICPYFCDSKRFIILSLHSLIPSIEQKKVFKRPPTGVRKIILSTNIAETAITIDDVVFVIDSGRMKEKSYDPYNNVSTLLSSWVSKANARQREGRAGRCQPGICYHLFSKTRAAALPDHQVKLLDANCKIMDFLEKTLDPPVPEAIRIAIVVLRDIGALTHDENLTELGEKLGALPVHPSVSKMLLFAILMNCLDPALTFACVADYRDPFVLPMAPEERKKAAMAKAELSSLYGGCSDQFIVIAAFDCWKRAKDKGLENQFCSRFFVSSGTMNMLHGMRKQLESELLKNGFIPDDLSICSLNAQDPGILRAVLTAGTYPMVGRMLPPLKNAKRTVVETASRAKASLHHHSSNFKLSFNRSIGGALIMYDEITRGEGRMYIKSCTVVGPYPLLLIATEMAVAPSNDNEIESDEDFETSDSEGEDMEMTASDKKGDKIMSSPENTVSIVIDRWLTFEATALDVAQIYCLRERLTAAILFKFKSTTNPVRLSLGYQL
ncbi:hypothetical protein Taro_047692, partial [Colocasia esculenta]|nr:hypothetical protein [Colocasia esculenta]